MKLKRNKKGVEITLQTVVVMIIVLMAMLVIIGMFLKFTGKGKEEANNTFDNLKNDCDGDGVRNIIDACPCDKGEDKEGCEKNIAKCTCVT